MYNDLIRNSVDEYEEERTTNLSAVVAAQSTWEEVTPVGLRPFIELCHDIILKHPMPFGSCCCEVISEDMHDNVVAQVM